MTDREGELRLVRPAAEWLESYREACAETKGLLHDGYIMHDPDELSRLGGRIFADFDARSRGVALLPGFVPAMRKWLVRGDKFIGALDLRRRLGGELRRWGGTLGIALRASARGRGLGAAATALARADRDFAAYHDDETVLFTTEAGNLPARRILEKTVAGLAMEETTAFVRGAVRPIARYTICHADFFRPSGAFPEESGGGRSATDYKSIILRDDRP